jgi:hypothetical protein
VGSQQGRPGGFSPLPWENGSANPRRITRPNQNDAEAEAALPCAPKRSSGPSLHGSQLRGRRGSEHQRSCRVADLATSVVELRHAGRGREWNRTFVPACGTACSVRADSGVRPCRRAHRGAPSLPLAEDQGYFEVSSAAKARWLRLWTPDRSLRVCRVTPLPTTKHTALAAAFR